MQQQPIEETGHHRMSEMASAPGEETCFLTTYGRDGGAHEIEMRYAQHDDVLYMLATKGGATEWVQNLLRNPEASLRMGAQKRAGMGRVITSGDEDEQARRLLAEKYRHWHEGQEVDQWAGTALPIAIDLLPLRR